MGEQVLITGGAGFIGVHLARTLAERGDEVIIVDDHSRGKRDSDLLELLRSGNVRLIEHDLTNPPGRHFDNLRPDLIVHLAAIVGVRRTSERPEDVVTCNLLTLRNILGWALRVKPRAFLFSSTSEVADGAIRLGLAELPVGEEVPFACAEPHHPRASYSMSKACGETLVAAVGRRHGLPVRIARYFNVYGPRMGHEHVIPELIGRALEKQSPLQVFGGQATRAFCYISDAVAATVRLLDHPSQEPLIVNVGNGREEILIADLAKRILALAGYEAQLTEHSPPDGSPTRRCPNVSRLRSLTGFEATVGLEDGLRQTFTWYASINADGR